MQSFNRLLACPDQQDFDFPYDSQSLSTQALSLDSLNSQSMVEDLTGRITAIQQKVERLSRLIDGFTAEPIRRPAFGSASPYSPRTLRNPGLTLVP